MQNKVNGVQIDTAESLTGQDPWELPEVQVNYTKWSGKVMQFILINM
jgi:hypothetical protein